MIDGGELTAERDEPGSIRPGLDKAARPWRVRQDLEGVDP
jgi:hypothetical protein